MKRITILLLLTCFSVFGQTEQIDTIKFDGIYETNGNKISFSTKSKSGIVNYRGRITKKGFIKLKSKSSINGSKSQEQFQFIKTTGLK